MWRPNNYRNNVDVSKKEGIEGVSVRSVVSTAGKDNKNATTVPEKQAQYYKVNAKPKTLQNYFSLWYCATLISYNNQKRLKNFFGIRKIVFG